MEKPLNEDQIHQAMPTAFRVALRTLDAWGYSPDEMAPVLELSPAQVQRYRATGLAEKSVTDDLTVRVSLILGIERALEILLAEETDIRDWVNHPSAAPIFKGSTPKSVMLDGRLDDLREIRMGLDGWLSGDFA